MNGAKPESQANEHGKSKTRTALGLVLAYAVVSTLWIVIVDRILMWLFDGPELKSTHYIHDWLIVIVTSVLAYWLVRRQLEQMRDQSRRQVELQEDLTKTTARLQVALGETEHLKEALNRVPGYIYIKDAQLRFVYANHATLELFGVSLDALVGCDNSRFFPPDVVRRMQAIDQRVLSGENSEEEINVIDESGKRTVYWEAKSPVYADSEQRQIVGLCGVSTDITQLRIAAEWQDLVNRRSEGILALPAAAERMTEREFLQHGLELAEELTASQIGFIHFVHDDQETIELVNWSRNTLKSYCHAAFDNHYPVSQAGIWADALRQRVPVTVNAYATATGKHGLPDGHARLDRLISVPVIEGGLVRMMAGVGNKETDYTERDVETVRLVCETAWRIVGQRRAAAALRASEERHRLLANNASDVIWTMDLEGHFTYVSPSVKKLRGYTSEEVMQQSIEQTLCPASAAIAIANLGRSLEAIAQGLPFEPFMGELEQPCKDGSTVWTEVSTNGLLDDQGKLMGLVGVTRDITQRRAQQEQLQLAAQVLAQGREGITVTDASGRIILVNQAFTEITGYTQAEVLGQNPRMLQSGRQSAEFYSAMWDAILADGHWAGEVWNRRKDGSVYAEWLVISALRNAQRDISHYVGSFSDLSSVKAAENRILWLSHFDPLTGLPNRTTLHDRAAMSLSVVQRAEQPLAVMMVSVDQFGSISETRGHQVGDQLLVEVSQRLREGLREQDTVARLGSHEFVVLLPETPPSGAARVATEKLEALMKSILVDGQEIYITASIGLACFPENGTDLDALLKSAEIALHKAQNRGRGSYQFFNNDMYEQMAVREQIRSALRHAIALDQLHLLYQPQAELKSGKLCGLEALLRWEHPEFGLVPPSQFIPLAEDAGLIIEIGEWVFRQVCRDIGAWRSKQLTVPHVAINVSPLQFYDTNFLAMVASAISGSQIDPGLLYIEITEGALMHDVPHSESMIRSLKEIGVKLSLDDFGTGYSSLSYLKRFPFDQVKIDQSFVSDVTHDPNNIMLVQVIVSMAHGLGMLAIAEGVETEAQCEIMRTSACDEIQGYFFSRPIDGAQLETFLTGGETLPAHLLHLQKPQRTLLLVDDEPNILTALKRLFRRDGHLILSANSGAQALELLTQHRVDVIITDQRMPGMTGVEMLRAVKELYPDTIRIVLSGYTELQSVTDAINEGAVYRFLTKPWDDAQLREQVFKAFEQHDLAEQNRELDLRVRSANRELVAANRHLAELLDRERSRSNLDTIGVAQ
jgi:diguanylate cyclase (GGDEF)-like protein/PAS domain S-box-containing protein